MTGTDDLSEAARTKSGKGSHTLLYVRHSGAVDRDRSGN